MSAPVSRLRSEEDGRSGLAMLAAAAKGRTAHVFGWTLRGSSTPKPELALMEFLPFGGWRGLTGPAPAKVPESTISVGRQAGVRHRIA
jgi:hypothetical protein